MTSLRVIAAAVLMSTTLAAPAMARDYCDAHRCYHRGPVGAAIGTAGAIAGAAIGTAGAIATAPFRNSYAYDRDYRREGFACEPGTWFRGEDGRRHLCQ